MPKSFGEWIVYADERGRMLGNSSKVPNLEALATARFSFNLQAREAFIVAYLKARERKARK
jgi:hypothetical protein